MGNPTSIAVVGAGIGGLSAAVALAGKGYDVTVFESHDAPGGKLRALEVGTHLIDSGPTVFSMRWIFDNLFTSVNRRLEDYLCLVPAEQLARHFWMDGTRLDLFADIDASCAAIDAFSGPRDADAYRDFVKFSAAVFDTLDRSFMQAQRPGLVQLTRNVGLAGFPGLLKLKPFASLFHDLQRRFRDPRLVQLFARYATYCGSSPLQAPATLALISEAERRGVWRVRGGMQQLAIALARLLTELGGTLRCSTPVKEILTSNNRATGLVVDDDSVAQFDAIVFNGDTNAIATGQLGAAVAHSVAARKPASQSLSAITWSFTGTRTGPPLAHHNVFFAKNYQDEFKALFHAKKVCREPTVYLCASATPAARSANNQTDSVLHEPMFALINAPPGQMSEAHLQDAEQRARAVVVAAGVKLAPDMQSLQRTTPADFAALFPGSAGSIYGSVTHGWRGSFSRSGARSNLAGLYFAGASVHPGAGIPMAAQSGQLAAACVDQDLGQGTSD